MNLPPGTGQLPSERETWEEVFESSSAFASMPDDAKQAWSDIDAISPLTDLLDAVMGWAWNSGAEEALGNEQQARDQARR